MDSPEPLKLVTPSEARQVEPVVPEPDKLALKELENSHAQATQKFEQGWIGKFCGSRSEKAGNIAFLAIVACLLIITGALFGFGLTDAFFKLLAALVSVVTLALGYLFGAHNNRS